MPEVPTEEQTALDLAREHSEAATQAASADPADQSLAGSRRGLEVWRKFLAGEHWLSAEREMIAMWTASVSSWLVDAMILGDQTNLAAAVDILTKAHQTATQTSTLAEPFVSVLLRTATAAQLRVQQSAWLQEQGTASNVGSVLRTIVKEPGATTHRLRCFLSIDSATLEEILCSLQDCEQIEGEPVDGQMRWTAGPLGYFTVQQWSATQ